METNDRTQSEPQVRSSELVRRERAHDKKWVVLMIVAIVVGIQMRWPVNLIQPILCGLMLAHKVGRLIKSA